MEKDNATRTVVDAAVEHLPRAHAVEYTVDSSGTPVVAVPRNCTLQSLESVLWQPSRPRGTTRLHDAASFATRVARLKTADTTIYCGADLAKLTAKLVAVFNDHGDGARWAGWCDFRAVYEPRPSVEWVRWTGANRTAMAQAEFAAFLEDNLGDVASVEGLPTGSQMLELALNMEAQQERRLRSSIRLQSGGVELTYVDKDDAGTEKRLKVYERFAIGIAPFLNGERYQVTARLRYRAKDGAVTFWFELVRPDLVFADALAATVKGIEDASGLVALYGEPPEPLAPFAVGRA